MTFSGGDCSMGTQPGIPEEAKDNGTIPIVDGARTKEGNAGAD